MDAERFVDLLLALDPLSDLPRTGWLLRGVRPCESIADHCFGVAVVAMFLVDELRAAGEQVDGERVLRMALLHDAAEARTGDLPMPQKTPAFVAALHAAEALAVSAFLPEPALALWQEVEARETLEARVVAAADKVQLMLKVLAYERQHRGDLEEFWHGVRNFDDRGIAPARAVLDAICRRAGRPRPA